jgi:hypothetical protein
MNWAKRGGSVSGRALARIHAEIWLPAAPTREVIRRSRPLADHGSEPSMRPTQLRPTGQVCRRASLRPWVVGPGS